MSRLKIILNVLLIFGMTVLCVVGVGMLLEMYYYPLPRPLLSIPQQISSCAQQCIRFWGGDDKFSCDKDCERWMAE